MCASTERHHEPVQVHIMGGVTGVLGGWRVEAKQGATARAGRLQDEGSGSVNHAIVMFGLYGVDVQGIV